MKLSPPPPPPGAGPPLARWAAALWPFERAVVASMRCRGGRKMHSDLVATRKAERGARYCSVHCLLR